MACAVAFGITRHSFRAAIDQAQNSKKIIEQQLSLAVGVARFDSTFFFVILISLALKRIIQWYLKNIICRLVQCVFEQHSMLPYQGLQKLGDTFWDMKIIDRTGKKNFDIGKVF